MNDTPDRHADPWHRPHVACVRLAMPEIERAGSGEVSERWISAAVTFSHAQTTVRPSGLAAAASQSSVSQNGSG